MKTINGLIVWFIATLYVVYAFTLNTAASVFLPSIKSGLGLSTVQATVAVTWFIVGYALFQIPAGWLLDRFLSRYVVSIGILLLALGNLLITYASDLIFFSLANLIQGVGASFGFVAAGLLTGQWFKPSLFPILFGLTQTLSCILSALLHYYFAQALEFTTWQHVYQVLFYAGIVLFIASMVFVRNPKGWSTDATGSLLESLRTVCNNRQLWFCTVAVATSFGVLLSYAEFWYSDIQLFYSVPRSQSNVISGLIFLGIGVGTPLLGYLSNRLQSRIMVIHISLAIGVIFLLAGIYLPHFSMQSLILIKTVSFFIGFFLAGSMLFFTIINEIFPAEVKGIALSITNTGLFLFNSLMLFLPYSLATSTQFFTRLWLLPATLMIALIFLYFVKESYSPLKDS